MIVQNVSFYKGKLSTYQTSEQHYEGAFMPETSSVIKTNSIPYLIPTFPSQNHHHHHSLCSTCEISCQIPVTSSYDFYIYCELQHVTRQMGRYVASTAIRTVSAWGDTRARRHDLVIYHRRRPAPVINLWWSDDLYDVIGAIKNRLAFPFSSSVNKKKLFVANCTHKSDTNR
jgi:hypothetical protein